MAKTKRGFQQFFDSYLETALWSSMDESDESGGDPLDKNYSAGDISPESVEAQRQECLAFFDANCSLWDDDGRAGHDFWLTRNRHGAGFWDGDYPEPQATKLTDASHAFGEVNLYVGDDGVIHAT